MNEVALVIGGIFLVVLVGLAIYEFVKLERDKQLEMLSQWLIVAVTQVEKQLGDGTGQLKLRMVYDMFLDKFKFLAKMITFEQFSALVDLALIQMRDMIDKNINIKQYVQGE